MKFDSQSTLNYWLTANSFREAAHIVYKTPPKSVLPDSLCALQHPIYFLACRSIELGFKAFLRGHAYGESDFRKISHDLCKGSDEAIKMGISQYFTLTPQEQRELKHVNDLYSKKDIEYPHGFAFDTVSVEHLLEVADRLLATIKDYSSNTESLHNHTSLAN